MHPQLKFIIPFVSQFSLLHLSICHVALVHHTLRAYLNEDTIFCNDELHTRQLPLLR